MVIVFSKQFSGIDFIKKSIASGALLFKYLAWYCIVVTDDRRGNLLLSKPKEEKNSDF